jgi:2-(1,2-epoxy-1,2-dihydrophenyl)acetyl-CoA isomerase
MRYGDVTLDISDQHVGTVEIHRPPSNFFDLPLINDVAAAYEAADLDGTCRALVLCSEGRSFCAGADLNGQSEAEPPPGEGGLVIYQVAGRLFDTSLPVVAAVQGAAVGGGFGLACSSDFRVGCAETRFSAIFSRLGIHPGFGVTATLPAIVGHQRAIELLYTGRRIGGVDAFEIGLLDRLVPQEDVRNAAREFAEEIASSAPLPVQSIRRAMRGHLAEAFRTATAQEDIEQRKHRETEDFAEGTRAVFERRPANFVGR